MDIPATEGAPVLAAGPGKVVWAGYGLYSGPTAPDDPYGLAVVIRHDFGYQGQQLFTLYAHLSRVDVIRGQYLQTSEPLGLVGDTGFTTGAHLHFEIRKGENYLYATLNPELWIAPPQGWGVLAARVTSTGRRQLYNFPVTVRNLDTGQTWKVITYGSEIDVNSDPYYEENMVIGDLPAGNYQIEITYLGRTIQWDIQIHPGQVSYFTFRGRNGFFGGPPPTPEADFTPLP
ncbi:MAG: peptidoglycan DD-metalloendopeptidase family protein [Anaerolineales bacterium]